jgi:hypothetical protein
MKLKQGALVRWISTGCGLVGLIMVGLMVAIPCRAEVSVSGYVESDQIIQLDEDNDFLSSQTGGRLELTAESDETRGFLSGDLFDNDIETDQDQLRLREAYLDYQAGEWNFRVGRQVIAWGKADNVTVTDLICPIDYRDYFCYEFSDTKKPVEALKIRFNKENMTTELVWVPFFEAVGYPAADNPWLKTEETAEITVQTAAEPEKNLKNSEWFGRVTFNREGFDYALSAFRCWWDTPVYQAVTESSATTLQGEYYRVNGIGGEFSVPVGDLVVRGETAFFKDRRFERDSYSGDYLERDALKMLLGLDWYPGNNWTISSQVADEIVLDYDKAIARDRHDWLGTLKLSKKLLRETLTLSGLVCTALDEEDYYLKLSGEYALTDELHLTCGLLFFDGDADGTFGQYRDQDGLLVKLKYSF